MTKAINLTVENKLVLERRDMNVYNHFRRSAHLISYNSSVVLPLRATGDGDYLHVSIVSGPGHLENPCVADLPAWLDFEFSPGNGVTVVHSGERTRVKIPPGPPIWQLKITHSLSPMTQLSGSIIIGDG
ncbi:MAG: hypothetical protein ACM3SY_16040 [Candidatus Omnitrophota bacterium]